MTSRSCFLTTASSCEKAHVIDKGEGLQNFIKAYTLIYGEEPPQGSEDVQNVLYVREDYHRDYMDSRTMPQDLKQRRIGFDFINKECIIEDRDSHEIIIKPWKYVPDVRPVYFAWSNSTCTRKLIKTMKRRNRDLIDWQLHADY